MRCSILLLLLLSLISSANAEVYRQPAGMADLKSPFIAAGYNALFTCSATFIAGRALEDIKKIELADTIPLQFPDPVIDEARHVVTVNYGEDSMRIAAFRQGMGCTLLPPHWQMGDIPRLPYVAYDLPSARTAIPWPMGDAYVVSEPDHLKQVLDGAFDSETYGQGTVTVAVMVLKNGKVIAERYREGFGPFSGYRTWSTAKSISASVIGIAVGKGLLDIDEPAPVPEWQQKGDPRQKILLKELLWMSSGLFGGGNNTAAVYFGGQDVISAVTSTPLEAEPATRWKYANNDSLLALRALRYRIDNDLDYLRFP